MTRKNNFLGGVLLVQVQKFGNGSRFGLGILHQCDKRVTTKKPLESFKG